MALVSRGINWSKVLARAADNPQTLAAALAQLSADLEDIDFRLEGGTNDLNQAQATPTQDNLERGTQFLTPGLVTSLDESVTITRDPNYGTVDLSAGGNSRPFTATIDSQATNTAALTDLTCTEIYDPSSSFSSGTYTFPVNGVFYAFFSCNLALTYLSSSPATIAEADLAFGGTFASLGTISGQILGRDSAFAALTQQQAQDTFCLSGVLPVTAGGTVTVQAKNKNALASAFAFGGTFTGFYLST